MPENTVVTLHPCKKDTIFLSTRFNVLIFHDFLWNLYLDSILALNLNPRAMKTILTFLLISLFVSGSAQENKIEIKSKIKQVTVFLQGAQVARQVFIEAKPGNNTIVLKALSPHINEQSIQAELQDASLKIMGVSYRINYQEEIKKSDAIVALEREKAGWKERLTQETSLSEVYQEEGEMLKSNKAIGGQQFGVKVEELKSAVDYFRLRLTDIKQKLSQSQANSNSYKEEISKIDHQLQELKNKKTIPSGEIVIKLTSKALINSQLMLNYLVNEARWYPTYDIRAKDVLSPISIAYKANVSQQSGEDWENVKLTISSGNPSAGGAKPNINTWYLGFNNPMGRPLSYLGYQSVGKSEVRGKVTSADDGSPLPGVNVVIKGTTVGTVTDVNGEYSIPLTSDAKSLVVSFVGYKSEEIVLGANNNVDVKMQVDVQQLQEVVVTGYSSSGDLSGREYSYKSKIKRTIIATPVIHQTNVEHTIDEPSTVRSDGENQVVPMIEYELKALFEYYCVPKIDNDAFLVARVLDWNEYNFLEGEANLFFEDKYLGKSILDTRNTSDTLRISLGRDKNIFVSREKMKDVSSSQLIGGNKKSLMAYQINIRNKKQGAITILVEDQIPVPNTKEITVDLIESSKAQYVEGTGNLKWRLTIPSAKTEKLALKYSVKYPKERQLILE